MVTATKVKGNINKNKIFLHIHNKIINKNRTTLFKIKIYKNMKVRAQIVMKDMGIKSSKRMIKVTTK